MQASSEVVVFAKAFVGLVSKRKLQNFWKRCGGDTEMIVVVPLEDGQSRTIVRPEDFSMVMVSDAVGVVVGVPVVVELALCDETMAEAVRCASAVFRFDCASAALIPPATAPTINKINRQTRTKNVGFRSPKILFSSLAGAGLCPCNLFSPVIWNTPGGGPNICPCECCGY